MGGGGLEAWVLEESEVCHFACPGKRPVLIAHSIGDHRPKYQPAGLDVNDEEYFPQEDHSHRRGDRISPNSVRKVSNIVGFWHLNFAQH